MQVIDTSRAIAEAFKIQHEVEAARASGEQVFREIQELEATLQHQRAHRSEHVQTDAARLNEAAQYRRGLKEILATCCEF